MVGRVISQRLDTFDCMSLPALILYVKPGRVVKPARCTQLRAKNARGPTRGYLATSRARGNITDHQSQHVRYIVTSDTRRIRPRLVHHRWETSNIAARPRANGLHTYRLHLLPPQTLRLGSSTSLDLSVFFLAYVTAGT